MLTNDPHAIIRRVAVVDGAHRWTVLKQMSGQGAIFDSIQVRVIDPTKINPYAVGQMRNLQEDEYSSSSFFDFIIGSRKIYEHWVKTTYKKDLETWQAANKATRGTRPSNKCSAFARHLTDEHLTTWATKTLRVYVKVGQSLKSGTQEWLEQIAGRNIEVHTHTHTHTHTYTRVVI